MQFRHPRALDGVDGHPPASVSVNRSTYDVQRPEGVIDAPEDVCRQVAQAYGVDAAELTLDDGDDGHTCEVCGESFDTPQGKAAHQRAHD